MFKQKMDILRKDIVAFATHVESMISKSIKGLLQKEQDLLSDVIYTDEPKANAFELKIDELSTGILAQFQPKAKDLRMLLMILRINNDLERIGDHAVNIADAGCFLISKPPVKPLVDTPRMADEVANMVKHSIDSFINEDARLAEDVISRDTLVDNLHMQILRELITYMSADPSTIERSLQLLRIAKNLERIADLATNICEDVVYIVEGKVLKHRTVKYSKQKQNPDQPT